MPAVAAIGGRILPRFPDPRTLKKKIPPTLKNASLGSTPTDGRPRIGKRFEKGRKFGLVDGSGRNASERESNRGVGPEERIDLD